MRGLGSTEEESRNVERFESLVAPSQHLYIPSSCSQQKVVADLCARKSTLCEFFWGRREVAEMGASSRFIVVLERKKTGCCSCQKTDLRLHVVESHAKLGGVVRENSCERFSREGEWRWNLASSTRSGENRMCLPECVSPRQQTRSSKIEQQHR